MLQYGGQSESRIRRPASLRDAVYVGIISLLTPLAAQHGINLFDQKTTEPSSPSPPPPPPIVEPIKQEIPPPEELTILWLDSPVTQEWEYDYQKDAWLTKRDTKDSYRSPPSMRLGMRSDGVVVWKRVNP